MRYQESHLVDSDAYLLICMQIELSLCMRFEIT